MNASRLFRNRRRMVAFLLCLAGLAYNGQTWADATRGDGFIPSFLFPVVTQVLPPCRTEDSNWCYWDASVRSDVSNGRGESFVTVADVTLIFD